MRNRFRAPRLDDIARQLLRWHDRSACHDPRHMRDRRLSSLDMQIPLITITNRAEADIMESRDRNVRKRHIRDIRDSSVHGSPVCTTPDVRNPCIFVSSAYSDLPESLPCHCAYDSKEQKSLILSMA